MTSNTDVQSLPELVLNNLDSIFYFHNGRAISRRQFINHAVYLCEQLPEQQYAINLCQNRYLFSVAFLAVCLKKQINLLPPNLSNGAIESIQAQYPDSYCLVDHPDQFQGEHFVLDDQIPDQLNDFIPTLDIHRSASISFTSGTTGQPKAIAKTWREFQQSALLACQQLDLSDKHFTILSTVPPQHMYGLETSLFWPLYSQLSISGIRPFFPEDIRIQAQSCEHPCFLISSPAHIKVCVDNPMSWNNIAKVLSSTAPISNDIVIKAERHFKAPLYEIYGSTETLSFASRRPIKNSLWSLYKGIKINRRPNGFTVSNGHLQEPVLLDDRLKIYPNGQFNFIGRSDDMVKVAGKRASLAELNSKINKIPGVQDAVFYRSNDDRVGAFVVSDLTKHEINLALKQTIDAVFIPRPLIKVDQLPRNEIGKLIKSGMQQLIEDYDVA